MRRANIGHSHIVVPVGEQPICPLPDHPSIQLSAVVSNINFNLTSSEVHYLLHQIVPRGNELSYCSDKVSFGRTADQRSNPYALRGSESELWGPAQTQKFCYAEPVIIISQIVTSLP